MSPASASSDGAGDREQVEGERLSVEYDNKGIESMDAVGELDISLVVPGAISGSASAFRLFLAEWDECIAFLLDLALGGMVEIPGGDSSTD